MITKNKYILNIVLNIYDKLLYIVHLNYLLNISRC